jgi:hypothetical protein
MNIKIKSNSLFKKLTKNINFDINQNFEISELINRDILSLNIRKVNILEKKDFLLLNKDVELEKY